MRDISIDGLADGARSLSEAENDRLMTALQREREALSALVESITDEVWFADADANVTLVNPAARKEFGAVAGGPVETIAASLEVFRADGRPRPPKEAPLLRALRGETITDEEEIIRTPVAGELRHRLVSGAPVRSRDGTIIGSVCIVRDVTDRVRAEEALRESELRYRSIVELADEDLVVSPDGRYSYRESIADDAHAQRRRLRASLVALAAVARRHRLGVLLVAIALELAFLIPMGLFPTSRHVLGMPGSLLALTVVIAAVLAGWQIGVVAAIAGGVIFWGTVADFGAQSAPITTVVSTGIWIAAALISGLLADALRDQTRRRKSVAVALARAETLREHEAERAAQEERTRIARDLHDSLTQSLFAASLKAESLRVGGDPAQMESVAEDVRRLSRGALAQMRTLLLELRGDPVEQIPLHQLLRNLVEAAESHASVRVILTVDGECAFPPEVHEAVYRITQEALNNVVRHSKAKNARVQLEVEPSRARLLIGDDGRGFDPASVDGGHFGLKSMRERAADSGGDFTLRSVQGEGTLVTVRYRLGEPTELGA